MNTVEFGMTGMDFTAGTADDYTILLEYEPDCSQADMSIRYFTPEDPTVNTIGACTSEIEQIDSNNTAHYRVRGPFPSVEPYIEINSLLKFDTVTADSFESGDFSEWTDVVP